ncbi:galactokinase [Allobaculum stercoricanis]|mgnify:CR=1 FL=1|uniref:galactokinase n=1 Tax=Allobaculum stercoricanis TaxID=174709 RepID=UPI000381F191|nr:galactokinase family protein [Allobaculum stercoricanis]
MLASQLKTAIAEGKKDERLVLLYGDDVEAQKNRYIKSIQTFIDLYGDKEVQVISVPGRSEVIGNHTDHQHGEVLATSINLDIIAVVSPREDGVVKVLSDNYDIPAIDLSDLNPNENEKESSQALIRGVAAKIAEDGGKIGGFDGFMTSDVLQGSGLSSSAAFEVMVGNIFSNLYNEGNLDPVELAKIGQYAENVYFGKPCGLMDQCACSVGGLIHIDFADPKNPIVEKVDVNFADFNTSLCITDVHASHADLTQDYADIPYELKEVDQFFGQEFLRDVNEDEFYARLVELRNTVNNDRALLRAMHVFEENKRVQKAVAALNNNDLTGFEAQILASGNSSFKYLQNIYSPADFKNQAVSLALFLSEKVLNGRGAHRVHGGGFAGTIQAFVPNDLVEAYRNEMDQVFGAGACYILQIRPFGGYKVF